MSESPAGVIAETTQIKKDLLNPRTISKSKDQENRVMIENAELKDKFIEKIFLSKHSKILSTAPVPNIKGLKTQFLLKTIGKISFLKTRI